MNDLEGMSTGELWKVIEERGRLAQEHMNWLEHLDAIKICVALIDSRIGSFQRRARAEKLLKKHRDSQSAAGENSRNREVRI